MDKEKKSIGVLFWEGLIWLFSRLSYKTHVALGHFVGWFLCEILRYRRSEVLVNISRSFPDMKYRDIRALVKKFYSHLGCIMTTSIWFGGQRGNKGARNLHDSHVVEVDNPELLNEYFEKYQSLMVLEGHTGNWEMTGSFFNYNHKDGVEWLPAEENIAIVYKELSSKTWDRVIADNRCACLTETGFDGYIESKKILRYAIEHRRDKKIYIFPTDQYPYRGAAKQSIGIFLNQETYVMVGGTALAAKLKLPVLYMRWTDRGEGKWTITLVPLCDDASQHDPVDIMRMYYDLLEQDIKNQPWNYLWTHRRWK